ncbi:hypothetical protein FE391_25985 [Nonomuraea sp. KC401]|uniref:hypothetical protein n=1 Tax=unclassified Nonomuraea TaxID=2593643 RepID=UPI0010FDFB2E|nr:MULTISPECIES: hypothetical protein [unclassified Nonomuraea]NBE97227.1 hypothetical protein [Nonomuraea sp. K271]TLF65911.1 hypothetical protein FE391_25985 [Nonomuraea sp. KC401]
MSLMVAGMLASVAGSLLALATTWVRERHRQRRLAEVIACLPKGSVYIDRADGVRVHVGSADSAAAAEPGDG